MTTIELQQVLPAVFAQEPPTGSDIWLNEVTFRKGKSYLLQAASGTGKTTLCSYIFGYRNDYTGDISYDGENTRKLTDVLWRDIRRSSVSCMFQDLRLFPELTAGENIMLKNSLSGFKKEIEVRELFTALGIIDKYDQPVARLSFGQQQRVAFIRALCQPYDFIILDEPVSHLDENNSAIVARILTEEANRQGAGIIVTSIGKHLDLEYDKTLRL